MMKGKINSIIVKLKKNLYNYLTCLNICLNDKENSNFVYTDENHMLSFLKNYIITFRFGKIKRMNLKNNDSLSQILITWINNPKTSPPEIANGLICACERYTDINFPCLTLTFRRKIHSGAFRSYLKLF